MSIGNTKDKQTKLDNYFTDGKRPGNVQLPGINHSGDGVPNKGAKVKNEHDSPNKYAANMGDTSPTDYMDEEAMGGGGEEEMM